MTRHSPETHWPAPFLQGVPLGSFMLAGQPTTMPEHSSAMSHSLAFCRQILVTAANMSEGQAALDPEHTSATSQMPAVLRQVFPLARYVLAGH